MLERSRRATGRNGGDRDSERGAMSDERPSIECMQISGYSMRTTRIDDTEYVAVQDFCAYLQGLVGKIVELTRRQQEHLSTLGTTVDILVDVIGEQHPQLREQLLQAARRRAQLV
jgi:hypothetical protein